MLLPLPFHLALSGVIGGQGPREQLAAGQREWWGWTGAARGWKARAQNPAGLPAILKWGQAVGGRSVK